MTFRTDLSWSSVLIFDSSNFVHVLLTFISFPRPLSLASSSPC